MLNAAAVLFGAGFTILTALALGRAVLRDLLHPLGWEERFGICFAAGAALLSLGAFLLCALQLAYPATFLLLGSAALGAAWRTGRLPPAPRLPEISRPWKWVSGAAGAVYGVLYLANAMAPEISPDGSTYHLGLVARYARAHGFVFVPDNLYAHLSQGADLLFLFAFSFGRHSAASLVHLAFLAALSLLMLGYARRRGFPDAGACAILLVALSPVVGVDATSAYNDLAVACVVFAVYWLVDRWREDSDPRWIPILGLVAGFGYAVKYTAFLTVPYALAVIGWTLWHRGQPWRRPAVLMSAAALTMILPWAIKNWLWLGNPFAPFFNALFPNPYVSAGFERDYSRSMRFYEGLESYWQIPIEVTVRGVTLGGLLGPVFLLAPLALAAFWHPRGRGLLLSGAWFGSVYFANIGTRFLIPPLPFLALALALTLTRWRPAALAVIAVHAMLSWPWAIPSYAQPGVWRLEDLPLRAALRIEPEEEFLDRRLFFYRVARMVEQHVPPGERVFTFTQTPEAYMTREVLVAYQSMGNFTTGDILWNPIVREFRSVMRQRFRFPASRLRRIRLTQQAADSKDHWSIAELRVFEGERELRRDARWRLRAWPNPWDIGLAFDNSPTTRWRSWQPLFAGMFVEADFGASTTLDTVSLEFAPSQYAVRLILEGQGEDGRWRTLAREPEQWRTAEPLGLRRAATREIRARGVRYLLMYPFDYGADDIREKPELWGVTPLAEERDAILYRLD
ncbi:MAG: glycosyltransferase family 39 protein [Bryobacterales bacterium]|nr:glycosyltransferase family 39 protein [Bryobacterales bacterium]